MITLHPSTILLEGSDDGQFIRAKLDLDHSINVQTSNNSILSTIDGLRGGSRALLGSLAPECLAGDPHCSAAADVWSFGCLLGHMIAGRAKGAGG